MKIFWNHKNIFSVIFSRQDAMDLADVTNASFKNLGQVFWELISKIVLTYYILSNGK